MQSFQKSKSFGEISLYGQRALVTGASSGIGAAVAIALARVGAKVLVNYATDKQGAEQTREEIVQLAGDAFCYQADVSKEEQVKAMFQAMLSRYLGIDILVNNAGIQNDAPFQEMSHADWERVLAVNLTGQFLCARAAVREFLKQGIQPELSSAAGKIICISSVHDKIPWAGHANYAASKGGVMLLMQTLAQEMAPQRIRVNSISPGAIKTDINKEAWEAPEAEANLLKLIPYGRVGEPDDIARAAVWLASDQSDYVTGATLYVDGGMTLFPAFRSAG